MLENTIPACYINSMLPKIIFATAIVALAQNPGILIDQISAASNERSLDVAAANRKPTLMPRKAITTTFEDNENDKFVKACRSARLRTLSLPSGCAEVVSQAAPSLSSNVEADLIERLGLRNASRKRVSTNNNLQDADGLASSAGSTGGVQSDEAASIVSAQRGAPAPPPGPH